MSMNHDVADVLFVALAFWPRLLARRASTNFSMRVAPERPAYAVYFNPLQLPTDLCEEIKRRASATAYAFSLQPALSTSACPKDRQFSARQMRGVLRRRRVSSACLPRPVQSQQQQPPVLHLVAMERLRGELGVSSRCECNASP